MSNPTPADPQNTTFIRYTFILGITGRVLAEFINEPIAPKETLKVFSRIAKIFQGLNLSPKEIKRTASKKIQRTGLSIGQTTAVSSMPSVTKLAPSDSAKIICSNCKKNLSILTWQISKAGLRFSKRRHWCTSRASSKIIL
jgi:hypothetical protein